MKKNLLVYGAITLLAFLYFFVATPVINPMYLDGAFFWVMLVTIYLVASQILRIGGLKVSRVSGTMMVDFDKSKRKLISKPIIVILIAIWVLYFGVIIVSSPLFFYKAYRDQMPKPTETEFTSDIQTVDLNQIRVVDQELASTLADKKLGEKPSLGSQVRLGTPTIQSVDDELVWVVPLQHSGFFKWISNLSGSAGYIKVSATNIQDVEYVDQYQIKIQPDSYLMDDLVRRVRFGAGAFTGITDFSFELDDSGKPYWVVTTYENLRGFALPEADGIILVDAESGDMQRFDLKDVPEWVDRVQPEDFIINQINNQGEYVHGIFNFSNKEKTKTSEGEIIVYNNGRCYLFTGITSVGADNSAIGFMMVDMVTKEPTMYRMSGATETAAMGSAQGKVQDLGYKATFPVVLNVEGQPTYFMTLKDDARLVKKYAFVSIKDYTIVGVGDTVRSAQEDYLKTLADSNLTSGLEQESTTQSEKKELTGTISRISWTTVDNATQYTMMFQEEPGKLFVAEVFLSGALPVTQAGDIVKITYNEAETGVVNKVTEFDNTTIIK